MPTITPMTRVLLAEDDPAISEPLARALRREGYDVDVRADGRAALEASAENPDLVVLDLGLPYVDGLEVCRRIRAEGRTVPVLILTARADEVDTVGGLVFDLAGHVPAPGEVVKGLRNFEFEILQADGRQVLKLKIKRVKAPPVARPRGKGKAGAAKSPPAAAESAKAAE